MAGQADGSIGAFVPRVNSSWSFLVGSTQGQDSFGVNSIYIYIHIYICSYFESVMLRSLFAGRTPNKIAKIGS